MQPNKEVKILIVDDESDMRWILTTILEKEGFQVLIAENGKRAIKKIRNEKPNLVLLDIKMPEMDGMEVLENLKKKVVTLPVIMMTAFSDVKTAVRAIKIGAYDYLVKPFDNDELLLVINRALERKSLYEEVTQFREHLGCRVNLQTRMGKSSVIEDMISKINKVATCDFSILIQGESGSGKELVAEAIHFKSSRADKPLVVVDCGAIPETLIESELFGYEKGAFTGADRRKIGYFEAANGGTLFFDEISNLPKIMQMKLLRVLQAKKVTHLGGTKPISVDVRLLCATNENLLQLVKQEKFRDDLFYRINEFIINVPPLRERKDDIMYLATLFLKEAAEELKKKLDRFSKEARENLIKYDWPGNVRELRNIVRRSSLLANRVVTQECFPENLRIMKMDKISLEDVEPLLKEGLSWKELKKHHQKKLEERIFKNILKQTGGNKSKAARLLKIDYKAFHSKVKELGIQIEKSI